MSTLHTWHDWARAIGSIAIAAGGLVIGVPSNLDLVGPRMCVPAIVLAGDGFECQLRVSGLLMLERDIRFSLRSDDGTLHPLECLPLPSVDGERRCRAALPRGQATGTYDLVAEVGATSCVQRKAVHVRQAWSQDLRIAQLCDLPVFSREAGGEQEMTDLVAEINLFHPDAVLLTGDLAYGGGADRYEALERCVSRFDAPVIAVLGNHEYEGLRGYRSLVGRPYHVVDLGPYSVLSLNSGHGRDQITESQMRFIEQALAEREGRTVITQIHHPLFGRRGMRSGSRELFGALQKAGVPVVLSGHLHSDLLVAPPSTADPGLPMPLQLVTTCAGAEVVERLSAAPAHYGYRILEFCEGRLVHHSYDHDGDGASDTPCSVPRGALRSRAVGDGAVRVWNDLNQDVERACVSVVVPHGEGEWRPSAGTLIGQRRTASGLEFRVSLDLPAHSSLVVRMERQR